MVDGFEADSFNGINHKNKDKDKTSSISQRSAKSTATVAETEGRAFQSCFMNLIGASATRFTDIDPANKLILPKSVPVVQSRGRVLETHVVQSEIHSNPKPIPIQNPCQSQSESLAVANLKGISIIGSPMHLRMR